NHHTLDTIRLMHQPTLYRRDINSGLMSDAQSAAVIKKAVDAQTHSNVIEKNVAGLENGFVQAHDAVRAFSVHPAFELPSIKCRIARAKRRETFRRDFIFQHGRGGHDLENGPWGKLRLYRAVQHRLLPV